MLVHVAIEGLLAVLHVQHELLDALLHRLLAGHALLSVGELATLARAAADLDGATAALREHELQRIRVAEAATQVLGLPTGIPLRRMARSAPEPLATCLAEDATALRARLAAVDAAGDDLRLLTELGLLRAATTPEPATDHERWALARAVLGQRALGLAAAPVAVPHLRRLLA